MDSTFTKYARAINGSTNIAKRKRLENSAMIRNAAPCSTKNKTANTNAKKQGLKIVPVTKAKEAAKALIDGAAVNTTNITATTTDAATDTATSFPNISINGSVGSVNKNASVIAIDASNNLEANKTIETDKDEMNISSIDKSSKKVSKKLKSQ